MHQDNYNCSTSPFMHQIYYSLKAAPGKFEMKRLGALE